MFTISFEIGNASFGETRDDEICRILREVALKIEHGNFQGNIIDRNGNTIGYATTAEKYSTRS